MSIILIILIFALAYSIGVLTGVYIGMGMQKEFAKRDKITRPSSKDRQKILQLLEHKEAIANNDVERLLDVSDATATRYLDALEARGDIVQKGKTGRSVYYTLNN